MVTREVEIKNKTGLHARPAAILVDTANEFSAELKIIQGNREANLKSIISLMSLAVGKGEAVTIQGIGEDAKIAVEKISNLIESNYADE